jgi:biopolymer transport protein ExbD
MNRQLIVIVAVLAFLGGLVVAAGLGTALLLLRSPPERIRFPESELAVRTEPTHPVSVTLSATGKMTVGDRERSIAEIGSLLREERRKMGDVAAADCTVFIYCRQDVPPGKVQQVIRICRESGFERFALRAVQE